MNHLYLYVALVGVAIVLFALTRSGKNAAAPGTVPGTQAMGEQAAVERELRATLDEFIHEFEQENARLLQLCTQSTAESRQQWQAQQGIIQALEQRVAQLEQKLEEQAALLTAATDAWTEQQALTVAPAPALASEQAVDAQPEPQKPAFAFNDKYARVVELSRAGLSAEQIARETDIGLGEIHFVLGLAKREEG